MRDMAADNQFLNLLFWSGIFDVFALLSNSESFFTKLFAFIVLILKLPIGVTCSAVLSERGGQFSVGGWIPGRAGGQASKSLQPFTFCIVLRAAALENAKGDVG